jgi:phenylpropionate dioxygenase-like ring-hydroxylating dioxygenase large terminal subunit
MSAQEFEGDLQAMGKMDIVGRAEAKAVAIGAEAHISQDYAQAERDRLWRKVWQIACRVEEIPDVGDYVVYDILDDTILITRSGPDEISAFYNVCAHRGKRLANGCGHAKQFRCSYHAWRYDLKGQNIFVLDQDDWAGALKPERLNLPSVRVGTRAGFVWINMDPDCVPLEEYLEPAAEMLLDPFRFEDMRYGWRMWTWFDCNWKTALEAFMEPYHVEGTHPQLMKYGSFYAWSQGLGLHGNDGFAAKDPGPADSTSNTVTRAAKGDDPRRTTFELHNEILETVKSSTTRTLVEAARRLVDELPEGTPPAEVAAHWRASAQRDDAARGVVWPDIDHEAEARAGLAWNIFPNIGLQHGPTFCLCYRVRPSPDGNPDRCIFEASHIERFPEGEAPQTEWVYVDAKTELDKWPPVLRQDFANMADVQRGMKSKGFRSAILNPVQERKVINFHENLARFMGRGGLIPLD